MYKINGKTKILAVLGDPIAHSLSPLMHNAAFFELGWDCAYVPFRVTPKELPRAIQGIRALGLVGVNLTIPHKEAVVAELDEIQGDALLSGSVNTIIRHDQRLIGTSTDGIGLMRSLREAGGFDPQNKRVLLLGAGGAAAAVIPSMLNSGIASLTIINRDFDRASRLQERMACLGAAEIQVARLSQLEQLDWSQFDLLINSTSVGLEAEVSLVPPRCFHSKLLVYDFVYKPGNTLLCRQAEAAGCQTISGLSLLLYQGAESFRLWFEQEPPLKVMEQALNRV